MRLHLVAMPHTKVTAEFCGCAYTAKALKFCKMMTAIGHEVILYAPEGSDETYAKLVVCLTDEERIGIFGEDDSSRLPAWPNDDEWRLFNQRAIEGIKENADPHDLVLLASGWSQKAIQDALPDLLYCEPGVGYEGILTSRCAFESYAWMHHIYGKANINDGRWYDAVIPNYFDMADFPTIGEGKGGYLAYLGRLIHRKGVETAAQIAKDMGMPLKIAGAGHMNLPGDVEFIGPVNVQQRAEFLGGAVALLTPTYYIEPFGGVAIEGMMSGTPVITTDWGAFSETVKNGVSGYRFRLLREAIEGVERASNLDRNAVRQYAIDNYSLEAVGPMFDKWFNNLQTLWCDGWYAK